MRRLLYLWLTVALAYLAWALWRSSDRGGYAAAESGEAPGRCLAETRSGGRCSRDAEPGSDYCWQHQPV
jgi:hypothetical protein